MSPHQNNDETSHLLDVEQQIGTEQYLTNFISHVRMFPFPVNVPASGQAQKEW